MLPQTYLFVPGIKPMRGLKELSIVLMIFFVLAERLLSQPVPELKFTHITNDHGLSSSTVEAILQDSKGFLWFGTADGLNRYDGHVLTVYKYSAADSNSISDNYINHLFEDSKKRLWISTGRGLNRYDREKDAFHKYRYEKEKSVSFSIAISCVIEDHLGRIWVATPAGLAIYHEKNDQFDRFHLFDHEKRKVSFGKINCLLVDENNNLWIGTDGNGLFIRHPDGTLKHIVQQGTKEPGANKITSMMADRKGNIWIGTNGGGLKLMSTKGGSTVFFLNDPSEKNSLSNNVIKCIGIDKNDRVWIGTENGGLNLWDEKSQRFIHYENDPANPFSLSQKTVSSFCEDRQGNIWIGTHRGGVNRYSPQMARFALYRQGAAHGNLSYKDVKTFYEDRAGNIYIGTDGGGINVWNRNTQFFQHLQHNSLDPNSLGANAVLHIMEDSDGNIWVGTWGGGLNLFDPKSRRFKRYLSDPASPHAISSNNVWRIFEDSKQNLWVATSYGGLNLFDKKRGTFRRVTHDERTTSAIIGQNIYSLAEDQFGNIWAGTDDGGLSCIGHNGKHISNYFIEQQNNARQPSYTAIRVIFRDSKDRLWVGQKGLYLFDHARKNFRLVTANYPLHDETIQGILEDGKGNLWISTTNGLIRYNPDDSSCKRFTTADGLQGIEFGPNTCLKTRHGEFLFGGNNGFNIFHPDSITANTIAPPVYLTDFQLSNKSVKPGYAGSPLTKHINEVEEIRLGHDQSAFSIEFAALNYIATEKNQYAYMLEGFDKDWNYVGNTRKATYTNINPGKYTFRVKASNNDGVWNEKGASVSIIIKPPFWGTWWFRTLATLLTLGVVFFYLWLYRKLEIERINEQKREEVHQMQLQFFTNISHEFRTPLSLIMGALENIRINANPEKYYRLMEKNTHRLTSLISELMDFRKVESGMLKLKIKPVLTNELLQTITDDFYTLAESHQMSFSTGLPPTPTTVWCDPNVVEKITLNLLNNAFKYTGDGGCVSIRVLHALADYTPENESIALVKSKYEASQYLYLLISDTGMGISKASASHLFERFYRITNTHMGSGIGLAFVKSLVLLHKGFIKVYSQAGKGTDIIVGIPCDERDYAVHELSPGSSSHMQQVDIWEENQGEYHMGKADETFESAIKGSEGAGELAKRILLVDDNDELRTFIRESLENTYRVVEAADGIAALEELQQQQPDLIISDLMMPRLDGIGLCKAVKENPAHSHIPFLMLTARDGLESQLEGAAFGTDFYFAKPVSLKLLRLTITNIFRQHHQLRLYYLKDYHAEIRDTLHSAKDKEFMNKLLLLLEGELENPDLNVEYLCQHMGMSQSKFYKKIKETTGKNITEFIRTVRLKKAAHILTHEDVSINQVMYMVGISSASYFTSAFKKEFGRTPSQYVKEMDGVA